jgi:hypothetical protein
LWHNKCYVYLGGVKMKKILKASVAVILTVAILSSSLVFCFAKGLNEDAVALHRGQYKNYVLLGDSVASGYRDEVSENEEIFNEANQETTYYRVPGSYADVLTKAIIEDDTMIAFAGPGFRTIEIRYMLEDDFDGADDYMFHPSHLDVVGDAGSEEFRSKYKKAIAEADLITLGVGGNDWGAYLGWVIADVFEAENVADKYTKMLEEFMSKNEMDLSKIEDLVEIAHTAGALPALVKTLPEAIKYGLGTFYNNWDIMIQDIYDLNPDVTLMVLGMSDNSLKGRHYDYEGVVGEPVNGGEETDAVTAAITSVIVEFIMSVGNKPMIDGAKKFGYTYVDTKGTTYVDSHPDADGHVHIANKIIEALPHPDYSGKFTDVKIGSKYYNGVEYVVMNNIMSATSATTFSTDKALSKGEMNKALNAIYGTDNATDDTTDVNVLAFAQAILGSGSKDFTGLFDAISVALQVMMDSNFKFNDTVTRGEAANYFKALDK